MANLVDRYSRYLSTSGRRFTREKRLVVEWIDLMGRPFDLEQLIDYLEALPDGKGVSRATAHRTVDELLRAHLIREVSRFPGHQQFVVLFEA